MKRFIEENLKAWKDSRARKPHINITRKIGKFKYGLFMQEAYIKTITIGIE